MGRRYKLTVSGTRDAQYGPYCTLPFFLSREHHGRGMAQPLEE